MSHWYDRYATPKHTIVGADGKERDSSLRDARKHQWLYSYSTVSSVVNKPGLNIWDKRTLLDVVEKYPNLVGKGDKWKETLIAMNDKENSKYRVRGHEIHQAFETFYKTGEITEASYICPVINLIEEMYSPIQTVSELVFAHPEGYGGTIDLIVNTPDGKYIIDFKTKSVDSPGTKELQEDFAMQLGAYRSALTDVIGCVNILVSVTKPGMFYHHMWSDSQIDKGYDCFKCLLQYCKVKNDYDPSYPKEETSDEQD